MGRSASNRMVLEVTSGYAARKEIESSETSIDMEAPKWEVVTTASYVSYSRGFH